MAKVPVGNLEETYGKRAAATVRCGNNKERRSGRSFGFQVKTFTVNVIHCWRVQNLKICEEFSFHGIRWVSFILKAVLNCVFFVIGWFNPGTIQGENAHFHSKRLLLFCHLHMFVEGSFLPLVSDLHICCLHTICDTVLGCNGTVIVFCQVSLLPISEGILLASSFNI